MIWSFSDFEKERIAARAGFSLKVLMALLLLVLVNAALAGDPYIIASHQINAKNGIKYQMIIVSNMLDTNKYPPPPMAPRIACDS